MHSIGLPDNRRLPPRLQPGVCLREMPASEKSPRSRKRGGVGRRQYEVLAPVDHASLTYGVGAPQHEDHSVAVLVDGPYGRVGQFAPAEIGVRPRLVFPYGQRGVE